MTNLPKTWNADYKKFCEQNGLNPKLISSLTAYKNQK